MAGVKGKSGGKATTAEEKAVKAAATRAREGRRAKTAAVKGKLGDPVTYGDLLKSVQVDGELLQNERRAIEVRRAEVELARAQDERAIALKDLISRKEHRESCAELVRKILDASSALTTAAVSLHAPEHQPAARHQFDLALTAWREAAMALIKESK